jgi:site-specific recombinase XerC
MTLTCTKGYVKTLKEPRDWAILAVMLGCGLRRSEVADLSM